MTYQMVEDFLTYNPSGDIPYKLREPVTQEVGFLDHGTLWGRAFACCGILTIPNIIADNFQPDDLFAAARKCSASVSDMRKEADFCYLMSKFQAASNSNGIFGIKEIIPS